MHMAVYEVFNQNNVLTKVTDADLEEAERTIAPLPTHLVNAAGAARRRALTPHLHATLEGGNRRQKLAAARALLALADHEAIPVLERLSGEEADAVVSGIFHATSLRLHGPEALHAAFCDPGAAGELKGFMLSIYPGIFDLSDGDTAFLLCALDAYLEGCQAWIKSLGRDMWRNDVYIIVTTLTRRAPIAAGEPQVRLRDLLTRVSRSKADADSKREAKAWLKASPQTEEGS